MITYNDNLSSLEKKTSLKKEETTIEKINFFKLTFPRKVKSKSNFIMSEIKSFNLTSVCSISALISEHSKNKCLQQNIVFLIRNNWRNNDNL